MMPTAEDFKQALLGYLAEAAANGRTSVEVNAGHLHRVLGGYTGPQNHRLPICCSVMRAEMDPALGDEITLEPSAGMGESLTIRYVLPRPVERKAYSVR
jgi:5-methylcytosine-specific restriction protein A